MTRLVVGHPRAITDYAHAAGLRPGDYLPVYAGNSHEALRGRAPHELEIVYVHGAAWVLEQPGVRTYLSMLVHLGAREGVA